MENLDDHITRRIERDNAETGSREKIKSDEGYIDKDEALVTAHAEKPFRDAARNEEYAKEAPAGTKEFLDWVASEEGEKALELFRTQSGAEKSRAREILLNKAVDGIFIPNLIWSLEREKEHLDLGPKEEEDKKQTFLGSVDVGKIIAKPEIEKILDGEEADKPSKAACAARIFSNVLRNGKSVNPTEISNNLLIVGEKRLEKYEKEADLARRLVRGHSVADCLRELAMGTYVRTGFFQDSAKEAEIKKETVNLVRNYLGLITDVREGKIAGGVSESFKKKRAYDLDVDLERAGFVFDEKSRKYIEVK